MPVLIDVLGSIVIGGILLIMLITFNIRITETGERQMYERYMTEHIEEATKQLNYVVGMAGIGIEDPYEAVFVADEDLFMFRTLWDHEEYQLGEIGGLFPQNVSIALYDSSSAISHTQLSTDSPKVIEIRTSGPLESDPANQSLMEPYGFIFWVDDLRFRYYDISDNLLPDPVNPQLVRSVELLLTFRRDPPRLDGRDLENRLQMKCYLMNPYMHHMDMQG